MRQIFNNSKKDKMDKKEYIVKQLHRTHNKKFENYCITRIWHILNDLDIKIVTQQYIVRPSGYALADLYFPQFKLIVEIDEEQHLGHKLEDSIRDKDVINAVNFEIYRIDTSKSLEEIHLKIDNLLKKIRKMKKHNFVKWDYEDEFNPQKYIDKGYIDIEDNAMFRTHKDVYNCFGYNYKSNVQQCGVNHKRNEKVRIWCPKLYKNNKWVNEISYDEKIIYESSTDYKENEEYLEKALKDTRINRYVFAHSKDNLGRVLYRFKGAYRLDREKTLELRKNVWIRYSTRVKTINNKENS